MHEEDIHAAQRDNAVIQATDAWTKQKAGELKRSPWANVMLIRDVEFRNGDVVLSIQPKAGTTWSMNIVHQLRTGGDADFDDIYVEVPDTELVERPGQPPEELLERWRNLPMTPRRAFKSHAPPPFLPFHKANTGVDVQYLIFIRNPEECAISLKHYLEHFSTELGDYWQFPVDQVFRWKSFEEYYWDVCVNRQVVERMMLRFLKAWWPLRHDPNVCLMHYAELKSDHEGSIRYIAKRLGFEPTLEQWPKILEYTSFDWMKANQSKFELQRVMKGAHMINPNGNIRSGKVGQARNEGMTDEIAADIRSRAERVLEDPVIIDYLYKGGALPPLSEDSEP